MQGRIGVKSIPGKGSTFWIEVELPTLTDNDVALETTECHVSGYLGERKRVLVVDDIVGNTSMLVSLLEPLGFDLSTAQNGKEAALRAADHHPHLVLLDLVMPELDGLEAAKLIRRNPDLTQTRIIGASATTTSNTHKEAFVNICDDFVVKPIRINLLLEKIGQQLGIEWEITSGNISELENSQRAKALDPVFVFPAADKMEELYELAMMGDMLKIEAWADELDFSDPTFRNFADRLRELAGGFKSKALLALVEQYREDRQ